MRKIRHGRTRAGFEVKQLDYDKNKIVWLDAAPASNTDHRHSSGRGGGNHLKTLSDLGKWINGGGKFKLAASAEFIERPDALPAFQNAYGFKLNQDQLLSTAGGDTAVTIKAAAGRPPASTRRWPRHRWPGGGAGAKPADPRRTADHAPAPIVRSALKAHANLPELLKPVFASLDGPTLQKLNAQIAVEGEDAKQVAAAPERERVC